MEFNVEEGLSNRSTRNANRRDQDPNRFPLIREQEQEEHVVPNQDHIFPNQDQNWPIQGEVEPNQDHIAPIQDEVEPVVNEGIPRHFIGIRPPDDGEVYEGMNYYVMPSDQDQDDEEISNYTSDNEEHGESSNRTSDHEQEHSVSSSQTSDHEQEEDSSDAGTKRQRINLDDVSMKRHRATSDNEQVNDDEILETCSSNDGIGIATMALVDSFPGVKFASVLENSSPRRGD